jgi:MFS family permease
VTGDRETSGDAADGDGGARSSVRAGTDRVGSDAWLYGWALGYAAVGAASLLIPLYAIDLGAGALVVSLIAATAAFAGVPGAILWGRLVTRTRRRRPFVLVALGLSAGVFLALPFLGSPWTVLAANAALWFVIAAAAPVLNVVVVEGYDPRAWAGRFGLLNHYQGYGWLAGLVAGGAWSAVAGGRLGLAPLAAKRLFFVGSAVATLAAVLVVVARYPEPVTTSDRRFRRLSGRIRTVGGSPGRAARAIPYGPTRVYRALRDLGVGRRADSRRAAEGMLSRLRRRFPESLVRYLAAATLFFAGFSAFFGPLPAYLVEAGYATDEVFALFVVSAAASAATYTRAGAVAAARGLLRLQVGALALRAGSFPVVAATGAAVAPPAGPVVVGVLFVLVGASWAVIAVTAAGLVTELAPEPVRAEALGAYTAVGSLGGGIGSVVGGAIAGGVGYLPAFAVAGGAVAVAAYLAVDGVRRGTSA